MGIRIVSATVVALALGASAVPLPATAQVIYDTAPRSSGYYAPPVRDGLTFPYGDSSSYDVAFGTRPSFVIVPTPNPYAPAVGVVQRCMYPNGWNVTDFGRDINGIPPGIEHTCPEPVRYGHVRARY